jgi:hypothetical protein
MQLKRGAYASEKSAPPKLPKTVEAREVATREAETLPAPVLPGAEQTVLAQEKGRRKRVPLV